MSSLCFLFVSSLSSSLSSLQKQMAPFCGISNLCLFRIRVRTSFTHTFRDFTPMKFIRFLDLLPKNHINFYFIFRFFYSKTSCAVVVAAAAFFPDALLHSNRTFVRANKRFIYVKCIEKHSWCVLYCRICNALHFYGWNYLVLCLAPLGMSHSALQNSTENRMTK